MKIAGNRQISAPRSEVWKMILDQVVLEKVTPGIKKLELLGTDIYKAVSTIGIGPVRGVFEGTLSVKDKVLEESCVLVVDQKSKMGNVIAEIEMQFTPTEDGKTQVEYTGEAKMSGTLARMGQRIMSGVVSTLSKQFFEAFEKEVEERTI